MSDSVHENQPPLVQSSINTEEQPISMSVEQPNNHQNGNDSNTLETNAGVSNVPTTIPDATNASTNNMPSVNEVDLKKINLSETIGGSQTRRYLNNHITPYLLEGMRKIAVEKPQDPLRQLGEYLIQQSDKQKNIDNSTNNS